MKTRVIEKDLDGRLLRWLGYVIGKFNLQASSLRLTLEALMLQVDPETGNATPTLSGMRHAMGGEVHQLSIMHALDALQSLGILRSGAAGYRKLTEYHLVDYPTN